MSTTLDFLVKAQPYFVIDEHGYPYYLENRINDPVAGREIFQNMQLSSSGEYYTRCASLSDTPTLVEVFDRPFVARHIEKNDSGKWIIALPFEQEFEIQLKTLKVDEWDRFHGMTTAGIPFVLSRPAQEELFDLSDSYDDESIKIDGQEFLVPALLSEQTAVTKPEFWSQNYENGNFPWDLNGAAPALKDILPRIKLPRSRVLVLGCGTGEDAALFAKAGHLVTAVDFSEEAIKKAKEKFASVQNIQWVQKDLFHLPQEYAEAFDVVFEHTLYCAIDPKRRKDLAALWKKYLIRGGHLLGIFFVMERESGPPFGGTEWEYRQRIKNDFKVLLWGRINASAPGREGKELMVYLQKNF